MGNSAREGAVNPMPIDAQRWQPHLAALLQEDSVRSALGRHILRRVQAASTSSMPAEILDELRDAVLEVGAEVLRLEWDCESPAGSGYVRLVRCADCFVLDASDDWPDQGPFSSLDEALRCSAFAPCAADECRITSTSIRSEHGAFDEPCDPGPPILSPP